MNKRPEKTERTKAELQEAFWRLYAKKPIEKITISQVCEAAGYNRGTFYLHYQDIYDILESIEEKVLSGMTKCVEKCMRHLQKEDSKLNRLAAMSDVILYYERNKTYIVVLLGEQGDPSFIVRLKDNLKPLWRTYVIDDDAVELSEHEIDLLLEYTLSGSLFMISRWLQEPGDVSTAQIGHLVYDAAIRDVAIRALG
jgi:AcrR family transcriptional regulator